MIRVARFRWRSKPNPEVMFGHPQGEWVAYTTHRDVVRTLEAQVRALNAKLRKRKL